MLAKFLLLIGACHIVSTIAILQFTFVGKAFTVGESKTLTYSGEDSNQPVQIYLYKGPGPYNPSHALAEIAPAATGGSFVWTPALSLVDGSDYTLEVVQGEQHNYVAGVSVSGSTATSASASGSISASATTFSSSTAKTSSAVVGGASYGSNSTITAASHSGPTAVGTVASAGTGTSIHRNSTLSKATLSHKATSTSSISSTTESASTASSTGGSSSSSPAPTSKSGATELASSFALVLAGVVAVIYLG